MFNNFVLFKEIECVRIYEYTKVMKVNILDYLILISLQLK